MRESFYTDLKGAICFCIQQLRKQKKTSRFKFLEFVHGVHILQNRRLVFRISYFAAENWYWWFALVLNTFFWSKNGIGGLCQHTAKMA